MTMRYVALCASAVLAAVALQGTSAHALTMAECSAKYKAAKADNSLNGMKWNDFRKAQCGSDSTAAPTTASAPAPAPAAPAPAPAPKPTVASAPATTPATTEAKPASGGRQAMYARERACGAEWKAAKANGTRPAGMKWPQFWHECDVRMKSAGK
jgi:hypothetical protein